MNDENQDGDISRADNDENSSDNDSQPSYGYIPVTYSGPDPIELPTSPGRINREAAAVIVANLQVFHSMMPSSTGITELRCLPTDREKQKGVPSGFFNLGSLASLSKLAEEAIYSNQRGYSAYWVPNPLNSHVWGRRRDKVQENKPKGGMASDSDVFERRWLLIDIDPIRDPLYSDSPSSQAEKDATKDLLFVIETALAVRCGVTQWIEVDSGSGCHLYVSLAIDHGDYAADILRRLDELFSTDRARVDTSIFNLARIMKIPGTRAWKPTMCPGREARMSRITGVEKGEPISQLDLLERLMAMSQTITFPAGGELPARPTSARPTSARPTSAPQPPTYSRTDVTTKYGRNALDRETAKVRGATSGSRNHTLNEAAFAIAQLVAGGEIDESEALYELRTAAQGIGLSDTEIGKTLTSAWESGTKQPRNAGMREVASPGTGEVGSAQIDESVEAMIPVGLRGDQAAHPTAPPTQSSAPPTSPTPTPAESPPPTSPPLPTLPNLPTVVRPARRVTLLQSFRLKTNEKGIDIREPRPIRDIIADILSISPGWPKVVGGQILTEIKPSAEGLHSPYNPWLIKKPNQLFSWLNGIIPGGTNFPHDPALPSREDVHEQLIRTAPDQYDSVEYYPHYPPLPGVYYHHDQLPPPPGTALDEFVAFFNPASDLDRALIKACVITLFWGAPQGKRPAFLFSGTPDCDGRGSGKTAAAQHISDLVGGNIAVDLATDPAETILSDVNAGKRVCLIDNLKTTNFSSMKIEASITAKSITGHRMYIGAGTRPNDFTWLLTVNGPSLSKDLAQRFVPIYLSKPTYSGDWTAKVESFIAANRLAIAADAIAILAQPRAKTATLLSRFGEWCEVILAKILPPESQGEIDARQAELDGDDEEAQMVEEVIRAKIRERGWDPDLTTVRMSSLDFAKMLEGCYRGQSPNWIVRKAMGLKIITLKRHKDSKGDRFILWSTDSTNPEATF